MARRVAGWVRARGVRQPVAATLLTLTFLGIGCMPIYGAGENLLGGGGLWATAYGMYWSIFSQVAVPLRP
jgi:hypothetical protein